MTTAQISAFSPTLSVERKLVAPAWAAARLHAVVEMNCFPDPHHGLGFIRSIYFDTFRLGSLSEKLDGDVLKRKARFRWYGEDAPTIGGMRRVYLEFKDRICAARYKTRTPFEIEADWIETAPLHDRRFVEVLLEQGGGAGMIFPPGVMAVLGLRYTRRRFICCRTGMSVAVDTEIVADRLNPHLCGASCPVRIGTVVCEFKGGREEIPWLKDLRLAGAFYASFSKYEACLNVLGLGR